jgi:hypothetical protein
MKTYPCTHAHAVAIHPTFIRKGLFLLFSTLITFFAFAGNPGETPANQAEFQLPLVLKSFKVSLHNKDIKLNWVTGHEKDLSHFVIERSTNGTDYVEVGVVFASGNSTALQQYSFPDQVNTKTKVVLYYRLKMMDSQKRYQYSPVRLVRIDDSQVSVQVQAYPNPVINELRITVPASWQNKQVSYELYNTNGNLVRRIATGSASQTETLSVKELNAGTYIVKAYTKDETASQQIVKR